MKEANELGTMLNKLIQKWISILIISHKSQRRLDADAKVEKAI
jgi:hypothetical protein